MALRQVLSLFGCCLAAGVSLAQPAELLKLGHVAGPAIISSAPGNSAKPDSPSAPYVLPSAPVLVAPPVLLPSPANPMAGVTLPPDRSGDGAYQGGGVVLEQDSQGVTRQLR